MKSGKLNFLEPSGLFQACNGTALPLPYMYKLEMEEKAYFFCYQTLLYLLIKMLLRNYLCKLGKSILRYMKTKIKYLLCPKYFTMYKKCKYIEITYSGKILTIRYMEIKLNVLSEAALLSTIRISESHDLKNLYRSGYEYFRLSL
jgi:hypothetical protein